MHTTARASPSMGVAVRQTSHLLLTLKRYGTVDVPERDLTGNMQGCSGR